MQICICFFGFGFGLLWHHLMTPLYREGIVLISPWGNEGVPGPHPGFGDFHILKTLLPFNCLQDAMSVIAVWFQDCICPCYSSFSAVISHCKLQYLPVLQNPAELIYQIISEVLTADLITDFIPNSAHHPSFACNTLSLEKLHRVCYNINLLAD